MNRENKDLPAWAQIAILVLAIAVIVFIAKQAKKTADGNPAKYYVHETVCGMPFRSYCSSDSTLVPGLYIINGRKIEIKPIE